MLSTTDTSPISPISARRAARRSSNALITASASASGGGGRRGGPRRRVGVVGFPRARQDRHVAGPLGHDRRERRADDALVGEGSDRRDAEREQVGERGPAVERDHPGG